MTKILSWVFGCLLLISLFFGGKTLYDKWQIKHLNNELNQQLMQANLELGKAYSEFGNAQNKIKELDEELKNTIKKNKELLTMYGELELEYNVIVNQKPEVIYVDGPTIVVPADLDLEPGLLYEAIEGNKIVELKKLSSEHSDFRLSIACMFEPYPNIHRDIPAKISYDLHMRFQGQLVQSIAPSGAVNHYFNLYEINDKGERVAKMTLDKFEVVVQKPKDKSFSWWNPKLDLGFFLGGTTSLKFASGATIGMSIMSYGLTKNDLDFRFIRFGIDLSYEAIGLSFSPVAYNVGNFIPIISNLWIGPYLGTTLNMGSSLGLQLTVGL